MNQVAMMDGMILLTGASGFVGSAFLNRLLDQGCLVRVLTRNPLGWPVHACLEVFEGNLVTSHSSDWQRAVQDVQVIVNIAAELSDTSLISLVNLHGPTQLLKAAVKAGVKRWVQLSSVGAYGPVFEGVVTEEWPDSPSNFYETSKAHFDKLLLQVAYQTGIEVSIIRPSNVYGSNMRNQAIRHMLSAMRKGIFAFIGPPGASANYVHVDDVVQALELSVVKPEAANQTFIVSAYATMEDMVRSLAYGAGLPHPRLRISLHFARQLAYVFCWWPLWPLSLSRVQAMSSRSCYSTKKIESELGWKLSIPLSEGMRQFSNDNCS